MALGGSLHAYNEQNIAIGEIEEVNVVRKHVDVDLSLDVHAEVQGLFEMTKHHGNYEVHV